MAVRKTVFTESDAYQWKTMPGLIDFMPLEEYAEKLKECKRSGMTTVTEEEVNKLIQEVKNHNENTIG